MVSVVSDVEMYDMPANVIAVSCFVKGKHITIWKLLQLTTDVYQEIYKILVVVK